MKKIYLYILLGLVFGACSESEYVSSYKPMLEARYLTVSGDKIDFDYSPSTKQLELSAITTPWEVNIPSSWVTVSPSYGNSDASLAFTAELNNSADESRVCVAEVKSKDGNWNKSIPITISQAKSFPYINLAQSSFVLDGRAQQVSTTLETNVTYTVSTTTNWINVDNHSATEITVSVSENTTGAAREGLVSFSANGLTKSISITQRAADISTTTETLYYDVSGGSKTITVESEASWTATSSDWIQLSSSNGHAGNTQLTLTVAKNNTTQQRNGFVYLTIDGVHKVEIPVVQNGILFTVAPSSLTFDSFGYSSSKSFDVSSNVEWEVTSKPEWLLLSATSGNSNATIEITCVENSSTTSRNGDIDVRTKDGICSARIHIAQAAKNASIGDTSLSFGYDEESKSIAITTDGEWNITNSLDWITLSKTSGTGDFSLQVTASANTTTSQRDGEFAITVVDKIYTVTVHQDCKYVTLSSDAFTFDSGSQYAKVSISSNTSWTATVKDNLNWLVVTPKSGNGNADITIGVSANNSAVERMGQVLVEIPNVHTYIIDVTQAGQYVRADRSSVDFTAAGGTEVINITTDGTYTISKEGNWFGYTTNGNVISVMAPTNSTGAERSGKIKFTLSCDPNGGPHLVIPVTQSVSTPAHASESVMKVVLKK